MKKFSSLINLKIKYKSPNKIIIIINILIKDIKIHKKNKKLTIKNMHQSLRNKKIGRKINSN